MVVLACLSLLGAVVLPALGNTQKAGQQAWCFNNLRLIGRAMQVWQKDHTSVVHWRTPASEGGTFIGVGKAGAAWYEYAWLSNQLVSPRFLACPSDPAKRQAKDFSRNLDGGYLNPSYRDNATSYWIGLDAGYFRGLLVGAENTPDHALSGDRNVRIDVSGVSCSSGVNNAAAILNQLPSTTPRWTNSIHGAFGNILFNDGHVLQLSDQAFRDSLATIDDNGSLHLLIP